MDTITKQVRQAQRQLNLQQFLSRLPWCWFATLLAAVIAIALDKFYPTGVDATVWMTSALTASFVLALVIAGVWSYVSRQSSLVAAIEIDKRYGLKERVSSSIALSSAEQETEAGKAVVEDAIRRVGRIDVREHFGITLGRRFLMPLLPLLIAFAVGFFVEQRKGQSTAGATPTEQSQKEIKKQAQQLRKRLAERRKRLSESGLKDADKIFGELDKEMKEMEKKTPANTKQAMIKLNKLTDKVNERRKALGGSDKIKEQMQKLKNFKRGPADKMADALKKGDLKKAKAELDNLKQKLKDNKLNDEEKKALGEQLKQMQDKLQNMANAHKQAMDDLKKQVEQAKAEGNNQKAEDLQKQRDKLAQQAPQMKKASDMAKKLGQCANAMKNGDQKGAQKAMDDLAQELEQMQMDMQEMAAMDDALEQLQDCKNGMCQNGGQGQDGKDGQGQGNKQGKQPGDGLGPGQGRGERPEAEHDTATYDTKVRQNVRKGKAVVTGLADGPNAKGKVRQTIKDEFSSEATGPSDPLTDSKLPRAQRSHVEQYFKSFDGEED